MRNALIYFGVDVEREILGKVRKVMRPGGFLALGAAETTLNIDSEFERRQCGRSLCYQQGEN
ncbi:MAG: hypothetical protein CL908_14740 [Deltaproteobacteria bacterium]|jgi:chemotaxis protein methyltransferase CheR|nr:hypothetical protein [Deltaproteobacteria bacterium]